MSNGESRDPAVTGLESERSEAVSPLPGEARQGVESDLFAGGAEETGDPAEGHPHRSGMLIFCPHRRVESVMEVTIEDLVARGIRGVILDLDNTLVLWQKEEMTEEVAAWLERLKAAGLKLCILSNSILGSRSVRIAERLGCFYVRQARKPSKGGFRKAMKAMETTPHTTAIVGDQMFTDILGGNRVGIYTIMVQPIHKREFPYTRYVSRPPERALLNWFKRKGHL